MSHSIDSTSQSIFTVQLCPESRRQNVKYFLLFVYILCLSHSFSPYNISVYAHSTIFFNPFEKTFQALETEMNFSKTDFRDESRVCEETILLLNEKWLDFVIQSNKIVKITNLLNFLSTSINTILFWKIKSIDKTLKLC